ncbi:acetyl-CoA acetyltransferase [uncultured Sphaerochaeta sp.]|uniref:acetyl-CoA acetyltransferase n=1 Tax=uncultured Sphaerochaeta sp. TaxID=886478 RepID=UPI002AA5F27A|nr:acetyl-CoA acetyltransferase [uncultured Sphaerochaeta sp.]
MNNQKVYVIGGAQTDFERNWSKEGKNVIALLREVVDDGLESLGLSYEDVADLNKSNRIAVFMGNFIAELYIGQGHLGPLLTEIHPSFYGVPSARYEAACASSSAAIDAALTKVKAGDYDLVFVVGWELMKTVDSKTGGDYLGRAALYETEGAGINFPFPKLFGRLADEMVEKYHLDTKEFLDDLAAISSKNYTNAKRNPKAQTRKWFMDKQQACSRGSSTNSIVGGMLGISDCSQITDGAILVAFASENFVKERYPKESFPFVKGWGHRVAPMQFSAKMKENISSSYVLPWTRQAVLDAYDRAQLTVEDIDFFETHDCFTSSEYAALASFGLCQPGKEHDVICNGMIQFDGKKPVNPSGGLIGGGHPVGGTGARMMLDLYKQVSGKAGTYQLKNVRNGLMLNIGGSATSNYVFIVGK